MKPRKLLLDRKAVIDAIFRTFDEIAPNGRWQINVPLGVHLPGESREYAPELLQSGSWIPSENNVCEISIMDLVVGDGFYCSSIREMMDFSDARSDGREEAMKQGLLDLESDELPTKRAQKVIDEYEDQAIAYAGDALAAMLVDSVTAEDIAFTIKWKGRGR